MSTRAEKKAEKRVCNICYEHVSIKNRSRRHVDENGNKCGARICKTCMDKILSVNREDSRCPFCRKELPKIKLEPFLKNSGVSMNVYLVERVFRLMDEGNNELALDLLDELDERVLGN